MVHLNRLEGPSLEAYLKHRRQVMKEGARINNLSWQDAWGTPEVRPGSETYANLLPGPEAAMKVEDATYPDYGKTAATAHFGERYAGLTTGENTNQINIQVPAGRILSIYGVIDTTANPALVMVDVNIGGRRAREWLVRPGQSEINDTMIFWDPIIIPATKTLSCDFWLATAQTEYVTFLGLYAEPKE